jgi:hypothetical protein
MNEDICPAIAAEEAVTLCIVEPLYGAFILCQWSHSLLCPSLLFSMPTSYQDLIGLLCNV